MVVDGPARRSLARTLGGERRIPPFRVGVCGGFTPALKIMEHAVLALGSKDAAQAGGTISAFGA